MVNKKGVFFSTDALIAIIIILLTLIVVFPLMRYNFYETSLPSDVINTFSNLKVGEIENAYIKDLIAQGKIKDLNKTILEQIGEFYVTNITLAKGMGNAVIEELDADDNVGIWYGNKLIASKNKSSFEDADHIEVTRQTISGIKEGESVTGFSSRSYLQNSYKSELFYFGGYIGDGNISINLTYAGQLENVNLEITANKEFDVYINNIFSGHYQDSISDFTPAQYDISAYTNNFRSGENIVKIVGRNLYVAGGYIKINYKSENVTFVNGKKYKFPGIQGLINLYDGFYISNNLSSMKVNLHMNSDAVVFLTIGNLTLYKNKTRGEEKIMINSSEIETVLARNNLSYNNLVGKTIPLRLGLENISYTGADVNIDSVLVTDVSGSMEWCDDILETEESNAVWNRGNEILCGNRRHLDDDAKYYCYPRKIDSAKKAERAFVSSLLSNRGPRIGIVEYSENKKIKKAYTDLSTKLSIGANPDCYESDWYTVEYDDSSWSTTQSDYNIFNQDYCDNCKTFFRRKFDAFNISQMKYVRLSVYSDDGHTCYINGKEIADGDRAEWRYHDVPKTVLNEGENLIACQVKDASYNHRFYVDIFTDRGYLLPGYSIAEPYGTHPNRILYYSFSDYFNPIVDESGNGNEGNIVGEGVGWTSDNSVELRGDDSYIDAGNIPNLHRNLTLEFWINPRLIGDRRENPLDKNWNGEFALTLEYSSDKGRLTYYHYGFAWIAFDRDTIKNQEWQHIVITRSVASNSVTLKSYINGILNKTTTTVILPRTTNNPVIIGDGYASGFQGKMDEVAIYNKVLTDIEILSHYSSANLENKWKKKTMYQCGTSKDPKVVMARKNTPTTFHLLATLKNTGQEITIPFNVTFYRDSVSSGNEIGSVLVDSMEGYSLKAVSANWTSTLSTNTKVYVDVDNEKIIVEGNEGDNRVFLDIFVYNFIGNDLDITSFTYSPTTICSWTPQTFTLSAAVKNIGGLDIPNKFNVTFYKDSISPANEVGRVQIDGLKSDESKVASLNWFASLTENTNIYAYADYQNVISEGSENNNDAGNTITKSLSDLRAYDILLNQTLCNPNSQVNVNATFRVINYNCNTANETEAALSQTTNDYSNQKIIPAGTGTGSIYNYFVQNFITPAIGTAKNFYGYVDFNNKLSESSETNNALTRSFSVGPDINFYDWSISMSPSKVIKDTTNDIDVSIRIRNIQCGPVSFKVGFYKDNVSQGNLFHTEDVTLTANEIKNISTKWSTSLSKDTTVLIAIDYENQVTEYAESNTKSRVITVEDVIGSSIFPVLSKPKYNPVLMNMFGLPSGCSGTTFDLFSPNAHIPRTLDFTLNKSQLYEFIDETDTWWGTCICCGINRAVLMLDNSTSRNKFMVVMSDGEANVECNQQNTKNPKQDAIQSACDAYRNEGIKVYSVCFGNDCDETTLRRIAQCGNGTYYYSDVDELSDIYRNIARDIINVSYSEQSISFGSGIYTELFPDSYIEFKYNSTPLPYGLTVTTEKLFSDADSGNFSIPDKSFVQDVRVASYSGPRWTDSVSINGNNTYQLSNYGTNYIALGDPYSINIPANFVQSNNTVSVKTAVSPLNFSAGSASNKIIYTLIRNFTSYSSIASFADGCTWDIEFEDNSNLSIKIPSAYIGENTCIYREGIKEFDSNDALQTSAYNLLKIIDFDLDGKIDTKFTANDLQISSTEIVGIPFSWSTEVQVRRWV